MKNLDRWSLSAFVLALISLLISIALLTKTVFGKQTAYIELHKVFSEFEMSRQYKSKLQSVSLARKNLLDSLELNLSAASRALQNQNNSSKDKVDRFLYDKELYLQKKQQFEEDNQALQQQYNTEITKQLNQYIKDYGEKNGYEYIYGAEGSGSLMYAKESFNISDQVIKYANERYLGNSK